MAVYLILIWPQILYSHNACNLRAISDTQPYYKIHSHIMRRQLIL